MNNKYNNLYVTEHFVSKCKDSFTFMEVNTLDVCTLDEIEYNIIKALKKRTWDKGLNTLVEKYGDQVVATKIDELLGNGILKNKEAKNESNEIGRASCRERV